MQAGDMIGPALSAHGREFGLVEVVGEGRLADCRRTAFTWTERPATLCLAADQAYFREAARNPNVAGIVAPPSALVPGEAEGKAVVVAGRAAELFYHLHNLGLHRAAGTVAPPGRSFVHPEARVHPTAVLGENVVVEAGAVIHEHCVLRPNTVVGPQSVLHPFVTLGVEGFFAKRILGRKVQLEHFGGVRIGEGCVLHGQVMVARSVNAGEWTEIGDGVHLGARAIVGHDCKLETGADISVAAILAGRVRVGAEAWIGAAAVVSNAVRIGREAKVRIGGVVVADVPDRGDVSGNFALDHVRHLKAHLKRMR